MDELVFVNEKVPYQKGAIIKVVGVGGAGGNAISNMISADIKNVEFIAVNTDIQALDMNPAGSKILLGKAGLGAGGKPEIARMYILETLDELRASLKGSDMVFITCGLGGGTGTGAAPVVAAEAKAAGALTVAVVLVPSVVQGRKKMEIAQAGLEELIKYVDSYIIVPNEGMQDVAHKLTYNQALRMADDVLRQSIQGISDIAGVAGHINIDFADIKTAMSEKGKSVIGIGTASGDNRARQAFEDALKFPLLSDTSIKGAYAVLLNVSGHIDDIMMEEVSCIQNLVFEHVGDDALIIDGVTYDDRNDGTITVTIVATGITGQKIVKLDTLKSSKTVSTQEISDKTKEIRREDSRLRSIDDINEDVFEVPTYLRKQAD